MRHIVHFDADAFFASVEQAVDPKLRGKPLAVGGLHRGIVASASYEARRFGVYTPMPMTAARRRCPRLVVVPPRFELYEQFSTNIFGLVEELTPLVEKQGVDEGYFDLTGTPACRAHTAQDVLERFGRDVHSWLKVTVSQGLARTKLLSQIAGKLHKPSGLTMIPPREEDEIAFLHPLPVKWLPGVGPACERVMQSAGITVIRQVALLPLNWLTELVGSGARGLRDFARNVDDRPVVAAKAEALSYGHQETFAEDTVDAAFVEAMLRRLADHAFSRLRADGKQARTVTVKIRYTDMDDHQGQASFAEPTDVETDAYPLMSQLLHRLWDRRVRLRMVQVKLSNIYAGPRQPDLFGDHERKRNLALACERIRARFGDWGMMRMHDWTLASRRTAPAQSPFRQGKQHEQP